MLKILVADDHPIIREGLKKILTKVSDMLVIGEASEGQEILEKAARLAPDVVLLDLSLPGRSGLEILKQLKTKNPKLPVLILSQYPEDQYALRALRAGASGYLTKESASTDLIAAIRKAAQGGKYVSAVLAEKLASGVVEGLEKPRHENLSDREYEILRRLGIGQTVSEIGEELCLSVKTISTYRTRVLEKMNLDKNADLIRYVIQHELDGLPVKRLARRKPA